MKYTVLRLENLSYKDKTITYEESLSDVKPIDWAENVLNGNKKVIITKKNDNK